MKPIAILLAGGLCLSAPVGASGGKKKVALEYSAPLVTSGRSIETAASRGMEVVRAFAASEPVMMGDLNGGGMVMSATCKQKFTVSQVLAGAGRVGEREVSYSFIEKALGFPLPRPIRPVAKGDKVVLVLDVNGSLVKVIPDSNDNRKAIETITRSINTRPAAAHALLKAMSSFTLKIEYHGPPKGDHPSLWCTTNPKLPGSLSPKVAGDAKPVRRLVLSGAGPPR